MTVRVIGVGQRDRGDDAAGLEVAALLRAGGGIDAVIGAADPAALLDQMDGMDTLIAVDCARGGGEPGSILHLGSAPAFWPHKRAMSSHGNALADALSLGAALGCLPPRIAVLAVVGQSFELGAPLSPAVRNALPELARQAMQEAACTKPV